MSCSTASTFARPSRSSVPPTQASSTFGTPRYAPACQADNASLPNSIERAFDREPLTRHRMHSWDFSRFATTLRRTTRTTSHTTSMRTSFGMVTKRYDCWRIAGSRISNAAALRQPMTTMGRSTCLRRARSPDRMWCTTRVFGRWSFKRRIPTVVQNRETISRRRAIFMRAFVIKIAFKHAVHKYIL